LAGADAKRLSGPWAPNVVREQKPARRPGGNSTHSTTGGEFDNL
jgi:hypothetical protein